MGTNIELRRRVKKACQRCRLKKCKCDAQSPCHRCQMDNTICFYGCHKKSDKVVFRKGYVQMLQRQQSQLNAGVQELYCRIQDGRGWPGEPLEFKCHGQAPVHAILERLGLLEEKDVWDEIEDSEPEQQLPEGCQSSSDEIQRLPETPLSIPPAVSLSKECIDSPIAPLTNDLFPPIDVLQDTITTPQPFRNFLSVVGSTPLMFGGYAVPPHSFGPIAPVPPPAAGWMNGENDWVDIY